jgi:hypothetical protein
MKADTPVKYDLVHAIEVDGATITSVTIRRPKGKDLVKIGDHLATIAKTEDAPDAAAFSAMIAIAAHMTGIDIKAAEELDSEDLQVIIGKALEPLGERQGDGKAKTGGA